MLKFPTRFFFILHILHIVLVFQAQNRRHLPIAVKCGSKALKRDLNHLIWETANEVDASLEHLVPHGPSKAVLTYSSLGRILSTLKNAYSG